MCTFQKAIKDFEVKVHVLKGAPKFKVNNLTIDVLISSNSYFQSSLSYGNSMNIMSILVWFAFGFLVSSNWRLLECSWTPLSFDLQIVVQLLCSCLYLIDAIIELHATNEKKFNEFLIGKWKWVLYVIKAYLIHDLYVVHVVKEIITLNLKLKYKYTSLFSSMPLVRIHFFLYKILVYWRFHFIVAHVHHLGF